MDAKTTAIVSHITLIGWVIALIVNKDKKEELPAFYIRQMLGLFVIGLGLSVLSFIPLIGIIAGLLSLAIIVFWVISLINAVNGKMAPLPIVGEMFQEWFKGI